MRTNRKQHSIWQRFVSIFTIFASCTVTALALTACGGSDSTPAFFATTPTVAAPAAPTAFTVVGGENVATLQWTAPAVSATAGAPASYEIYRSTTATTAATIVNPTNLVTSITVDPLLTIYSYTNIGLPGATTYNYVVTAKNAGGETPSTVASDMVTGPPTPATYGNNFSAALIFADDIGITNLALDPAKSWTITDVTAIDYNTGLRPLATEVTAMLALPIPQTTLPYLPVVSQLDPVTQYFEQKSINTWQGEWAKGGGVMQEVNAKWGDNLAGSASLSSTAKIRIEMALTKALTTPMTVYPMTLLSGSGINELQGTTGVATTTTTAFVMATNARLVIQKFNGTTLETPLVNQALFDKSVPDGLNKLSGEIPVSGNFTYGFVWDPAALGATAGKYRLTFKLDPNSTFGVGAPANKTLMKTVTAPGLWASDTEAYIDINLK